MESPLALYRRYRPETFAEVIGQDHVTRPLRAALANNRVNHAYLFSGPRGCGKTTSARILARCLNCEQAPTADPCGECRSCTDLARGGPGSIDVIEIDAASHGGVDDARDLREKAFFAPVHSRFKVYIIDEAHMVTTQGFNALLKLVEEPPPHLRFIFATTEPDKVLPTIRSRTHHYPFRLIPPRLLSGYLADLCEREGVAIEPAALPLVVRAGGGSARDTLSVLDQLLGGAGPDGVTHQLATDLLGYTHDSLLDEVVEAFAAADGAAVFGVVDKVVESGQDPRRFSEDLLRRLRDLVVVAAVPDAPATGLIDVPEDAGERLVAQAARFGAAELSRAADLVAASLTEMRGATAPRLLLELVCARVLLPAAETDTDGMLARLDRLEKRAAISGGSPGRPVPDPSRSAPTPQEAHADSAAPAAQEPAPAAAPAEAHADSAAPAAAPAEAHADSAAAPAEAHADSAAAPAEAHADSAAPAGGLSLVDVRRLWPDIVEATKSRRRVTWMHLTQHAQVVGVDDVTLTLGFQAPGPRDNFASGGHGEILRQAAIDVVGSDWRIEAIVAPGSRAEGGPTSGRQAAPGPAAAGSAAAGATAPEPGVDADEPAPEAGGQPAGSAPAPGPPEAPADEAPRAAAVAREAFARTRADGPPEPEPPPPDPDAAWARDDPDDEAVGLAGAELLQRELGARVIQETEHP